GVSPQRETGSVQSTENVTANAFGSGGSAFGSASAYGTSTWTRTQYIPWSQDHPYFQTRYFVGFALFDDKGNSRIALDAKELTLRIITRNGEQNAVFKLEPPHRAK